MSKFYFNDKISDLSLQITESYIQYGSEIIPTNAISYFAIKRINVTWWLAILLLVAGAVLSYYGYTDGGILGGIGIIAFIIGIVEAIATYKKSKKRYVIISSHSKHCIQIEINGAQYQQFYEPLMNALFNVVEDNNINNLKTPYNENETK